LRKKDFCAPVSVYFSDQALKMVMEVSALSPFSSFSAFQIWQIQFQSTCTWSC